MATTIHITWAANNPSEQVTSYQLWESVNGASFTFKATVLASPSPSYDILNPLPGIYAYKVLAQNLAGNSGFSGVGSTPGLPSAPETPSVTVIVS